MPFHNIVVDVSRKNEFVRKAKNSLKKRWYIHICRNKEIVVIFRNKSFQFSKGDENLEQARKYGISQGIPEEQLGFEELIKKPFD
ncbi:MAG: hypothetical protein HYW26_00795 [Candidatus Aenigmarchaeota archaeon]|nr:hypothetical protein [Candidatus Aenigmarchaeota archaeon]